MPYRKSRVGEFPHMDGATTEWSRNAAGDLTVQYRTVSGIWSRVTQHCDHAHTYYVVEWDPEVMVHPATLEITTPGMRLFTCMDEACAFARRILE